jgi:hypothetical protein
MAALLLGGCASRLSAEVTRFNQIAAPLTGNFAIVPAETQQGSLEFNNYRPLLAARLSSLGLKEEAADADYIAGLDYSRAAARETGGNGGPVNVGVGVGGGTGGTGLGLGLGLNLGGSRQDTLYIYKATVTLTRRRDNQRVFEAYATTQGRNADMASVLPALIDAIFENFPGKNGETTTVTVAPPH